MEAGPDQIPDGSVILQDASSLIPIEPLSTSDWVNIRHSCQYLLINRPQLMEKCNSKAFFENTIAKIDDAENQSDYEVMQAKLRDLERSQSPMWEFHLQEAAILERQRIYGRVIQWRVECAKANGDVVPEAEKEEWENELVNPVSSIDDKRFLRAKTWRPDQQWPLDLQAQAWRSSDNKQRSDEFLLYLRPMQRLETIHQMQKWSRFLASHDAMPELALDIASRAVADDDFVWARVTAGLGRERRRRRRGPAPMTRLMEEFADEFALDASVVEAHVLRYGVLKHTAYREIDLLVACGRFQLLATEVYAATNVVHAGLGRVPEFWPLRAALERAVAAYFESFVVAHPHLSPSGEGDIEFVMLKEWICEGVASGEVESQTREIFPEEGGSRHVESKPSSMRVILPERINKVSRL